MLNLYDYSLLLEFTQKFLPQRFDGINRDHPLILDLEKKLKENQQFIYIADLLQMKVLFTSSGSRDLIGVEPDQFDLSGLVSRVHPEDFHRHSLARSKVINRAYGLLVRNQGISIHSIHSRVLQKSGEYSRMLFQAYSFYSEVPFRTIYTILVLTDLTHFHISEHGYHYYIGEDPQMFRYPDNALLKVGHVFSARQFEIIKLIAAGCGSEHIADKLQLSINTVHVHRKNILKKTHKSTTHDLVIELQEQGIL